MRVTKKDMKHIAKLIEDLEFDVVEESGA